MISAVIIQPGLQISASVQDEIKGLSNVEKVLLDTADSVMETKRKIEFGVQQIIFKVIIVMDKWANN